MIRMHQQSNYTSLKTKKNRTLHILNSPSSLPNVNFYPGYNGIELSPLQKKTIQAITVLFESWRLWQRQILFSGLIHQYSNSQLQKLSTAVESLRHRDFIVECRSVYPMHKVKDGQYTRSVDVLQQRIMKDKSGKLAKGKSKWQSVKFQKKRKDQSLNDFKSSSSVQSSNTTYKFQSAYSINSITSESIVDSCASDVLSQDENQALTRPTSQMTLPSVWEMGQSVKESEDNDSVSRATTFDRPTQDYFPILTKSSQFANFATTRSKCGLEEYMNKFSTKHNKVPLPTISQLNKSQKFWSSHQLTVSSNCIRLKELFQKQIAQIWEWISDWEDHQRIRLLLHLLSLSVATEQKYVADQVKQKIKEIKEQKKKELALPYKVWLKIVEYLNESDVESAERVCRGWNWVLTNERFWMTKCREIGMDEFVRSSEEDSTDWRRIYFQSRSYTKHEAVLLSKSISKVITHNLVSSFPSKASISSPTNEDSDVISHHDDVELDESSDVFEEDRMRKKLKRPRRPSSYFSKLKDLLNRKEEDTKMRIERIRAEQEKIKRKREEMEEAKKRDADVEEVMMDLKPLRDIKEKEDKNRRRASTQKIVVEEVLGKLLSEEELEQLDREVSFVAVDYTEEGAQRSKPWVVDTYIPSVDKVLALKGHLGPVWCVVAHGSRILSGGMDRKIRFWSRGGSCYASIQETARGGILSMAIGADDRCRTLYAASWDRTISVYDVITFERTGLLTGHEDAVSGVAVNSKYLISCSYDATIRVWDIRTNELIRVIRHHDNAILCMDISEGFVITGGVDKLVMVSDMRNGKLINTLEGHTNLITAVKVRHNLILSSDSAGYVLFWSLSGGREPLFNLRAHKSKITALETGRKRFFTASIDKQIKEWNLITVTCLRTLQSHARPVTDIKFTGEYLVSSSYDGTVRIWWWRDMEEDEKEGKDEEEQGKKLRHRMTVWTPDLSSSLLLEQP